MQITDVLARSGGLRSIAKELGVSEAQAATGAAALVPAILGGFKKQAQSSGLDNLGSLLGKLGGGLLDDLLSSRPTVSRGNDVLGEIFGSKDVSRTVAQNAAANTGLSADLLKRMLPMVAMAVAGYMAKQKDGDAASFGSPASAGGLAGVLGGLLGGAQGGGQQAGGLASMLDMNGDGNVLDDIMRMAGKLER